MKKAIPKAIFVFFQLINRYLLGPSHMHEWDENDFGLNCSYHIVMILYPNK